MREILTLIFGLAAATEICSQTYWNPDSTGYNYLNRGQNLQQWAATAGTKVEVDHTSYRTAGSSIKWTIPPNSGTAYLDLNVVDIDLRDRVVYTTCRRNNHAASMATKIMVGPSRGFRLPDPVYCNTAGRHLAVEAWHQRGRYSSDAPLGVTTPEELAHVKSISFLAENAAVEQILWIDEIKYTQPRGPVCIIHFNHYRHTADSLLTPWLLANGYPANMDFTFEIARDEFEHNRANGGLWARYIGLPRILELVRDHGWSTTHHGVFYKLLTELAPADRQRLCALEPFQQAGFETQWCFSIPSDQATPEIFAEIQRLDRFYAVRTQGTGRSPNELPINEPIQLRFYRPTSASAGPHLGGEPQTLSAMKAKVDQYYRRKGLLILDFGGVVTAPSPEYTDSEITMLAEAQALIRYIDALGFKFLTFKDLFAPDPHYSSGISINADYVRRDRDRASALPLLQNDLARNNESLRIAFVSQPQHGWATLAADRANVTYTPASGFVGDDRFYYVATNGVLADTARVFVSVTNSPEADQREPPATFALGLNYPNPFFEATTLAYELSQPAFVEIKVYAIDDREVATLVNKMQLPGRHRAVFFAKNLTAGVYFNRTKINGRLAAMRKMIYLGNPR